MLKDCSEEYMAGKIGNQFYMNTAGLKKGR